MPKKSGARRSRADKDARAKRAEDWKNTRGGDPRTSWMPQDFTNARMEAFFKAQGFVGDGEWDKFLGALRTPLPACFRINTGYAFHEVLTAELQSYAGTTVKLEEGTEIEPVQQMKWVGAGNAYKLGADKRTIRKSEVLKQLHEWMMKNTDNGNITRQEAVSMVPPLALDVHPHHVVLDMCAAPGSKTTQMMEIIDQSLLASPGCEHDNGLVVANDADTDRSYMLVHQTRRMNSPLLLICTHKGQNIPKIRLTGEEASGPLGGLSGGYFDRVLADVPCSGDGTLRKNPMIWNRWNTANAITLHPLQLMIARRGYQVLKPGGLMVYSTCSMMPYEDEAVVAELLRETKGTANELELVDAREFLPLFKARAGMTTWHVLDDHFAFKHSEKKKREEVARQRKEQQEKQRAEVVGGEGEAAMQEGGEGEGEGETKIVHKIPEEGAEDNEEAAAAAAAAGPEEEEEDRAINPSQQGLKVDNAAVQACIDMGMGYFTSHEEVPESAKGKLKKSLFPPTAEELAWMHLERCLRCVPHDEDTGGFFVATLRKKVRPAKEGEGEAMKVDGEQEKEQGKEIEKEGEQEKEKEKEDGEGDKEDSELIAIDEGATATKRSRVDAGGGGSEALTTKVAAKASQVDYVQWAGEWFDTMQSQFGFEEGGPINNRAFFTRNDPHSSQRKGGNKKWANQRKPEDGLPKSIFFLPRPARELMAACELKVVSCGIKAFEKHPVRGSEVEYRLAQDAVHVLAPYMTKRKVSVTVQDLCNLLEGGLVSFTTLSEGFTSTLEGLSGGSLVVQYTYKDEDVLPATATATSSGSSSGGTGAGTSMGSATAAQRARIAQRPLYLVCFKGGTRALNVMCQKSDMDSMKHMLGALGVLRPKIKADKTPSGVFTLPGREKEGEEEKKEGEGEEVAVEGKE